MKEGKIKERNILLRRPEQAPAHACLDVAPGPDVVEAVDAVQKEQGRLHPRIVSKIGCDLAPRHDIAKVRRTALATGHSS